MTFPYWSPLADHLWQSTVFAAMVGLVALLLRKNSARVRFWLWFAASLKFLIPFSMLVSLGGQLEWRSVSDSAPFELSPVFVEISRPFAFADPELPVVSRGPGRIPVLLFWIWLCGASVGAIGWFRAWLKIKKALRVSSPLLLPLEMISAPIKAVCSPMMMEPGVVGVLRPVLMLPNGITDRLTPDQLKTVLLHEMCHVRWRDNFTAAIHLVVETLFWFFPLVRWIGKRLMAERERACDEEVVRLGGEPEAYAQGILNICAFYKESTSVCASGVTGSNLKQRIETIMRNDSVAAMTATGKLLLGVAAVLAIAAPIAVGALTLAPRFGQAIALSVDGPSFDVASVKRNDPGQRARGNSFNLASGRFVGRNQTLQWFVGMAYAPRAAYPPLPLPDERISGGPEWMNKDRFTIEALAGRSVTAPEMARMLRRVLSERFGLKVRIETREQAIYQLVRGNTVGKQLRQSEECEKQRRQGIAAGPGRMMLQCTTISLLAEAIAEVVDRPVFDQTGLTGAYDGNLEYAATDAEILSIFGGERPPEAAAPGPSIFTAVQQQLGLRLVPQRGSVDFLVVEDAQKPSEN